MSGASSLEGRVAVVTGGASGIGLALARGLAEAMQGTLQPEDTPGGGLTMVVSIPTATLRPADAPVPGARERSEQEGHE